MMGKMERLVVGCCGWGGLNPKDFGIEGWKEKFPSKLALYSALFPCVEVNQTFYRLPQLRTAERWLEEARSVREDFEFTLKVPQTITHKDKFRTEASLEAYKSTLEVAKALDAKILLFQTPKSLRDDSLPDMERFFSRIERKGLTLVLEPRGLSKENALSLCERLGLIFCFDPFAQRPEDLPGDLLYVRLHGSPPGERMYRYEYKPEDLKWLGEVLPELSRGRRACYCLFNNIPMHRSARLFMEMMGLWRPLL